MKKNQKSKNLGKENNWINIYSSTELYKIELIKGQLLENNIRALSINKKDSSYLSFGEIELYVQSENLIKAKNLIKERKDA